MEPPLKYSHKFSIWNLNGPPARSVTTTAEVHARADASGGHPSAPLRPLNERQHHSAASGAREATRPFSAKCVLPNGAKLSCTTKRVQPEWIELVYDETVTPRASLSPNMRIGLDLDFFGPVRGAVRGHSETGFSMAPDLAYHKPIVEKLAELHTSMDAEDKRANLDRLTARITPLNPNCIYRILDSHRAEIYNAKIAMLSHKVVTLRTAQIQRAGTRVQLGWSSAHPGTVLRSFESGFTVEFDTMLEELHERLTFC